MNILIYQNPNTTDANANRYVLPQSFLPTSTSCASCRQYDSDMRELGGALFFMIVANDTVFESYYAARAFRGLLKV